MMNQPKRKQRVRYDKMFENDEQIEAYMKENPTHTRMNYECFTGFRNNNRPRLITVMFEYFEEE